MTSFFLPARLRWQLESAQQIGREIKNFSQKAVEHIKTYPWPGNLRELRNAVERATILSTTPAIEPRDLPGGNGEHGPSSSHISPGGDVSLEELEAEHIRLTVGRFHNLQDAARLLGIDKATLYRKRKKLQID